MATSTERLVESLNRHGAVVDTEEPVELASGHTSNVYIDVKRVLRSAPDLKYVANLMYEKPYFAGIQFNTVGGLELGAVPLAVAVSIQSWEDWFIVRKETKGRGLNKRIEGADLRPGNKVLLVDDVVTTGKSIIDAHETIAETGAEVVYATAVVDRGTNTATHFKQHHIPYSPLLTYKDLGIPHI